MIIDGSTAELINSLEAKDPDMSTRILYVIIGALGTGLWNVFISSASRQMHPLLGALITELTAFCVGALIFLPVLGSRAATALPRTPPRSKHGRNHAQARLLLEPHSQTPAFDTYPTKVRTGDQAGG